MCGEARQLDKKRIQKKNKYREVEEEEVHTPSALDYQRKL